MGDDSQEFGTQQPAPGGQDSYHTCQCPKWRQRPPGLSLLEAGSAHLIPIDCDPDASEDCPRCGVAKDGPLCARCEKWKAEDAAREAKKLEARVLEYEEAIESLGHPRPTSEEERALEVAIEQAESESAHEEYILDEIVRTRDIRMEYDGGSPEDLWLAGREYERWRLARHRRNARDTDQCDVCGHTHHAHVAPCNDYKPPCAHCMECVAALPKDPK